MARRLESRSALARLAGVSPAAITKACKGQLAAARVGKRIDLDHPAVAAYLTKKGVDPTAVPPRHTRARAKPTAPRPKKPAPKKPRKAAARSPRVPDPGFNPDPADDGPPIEDLLHLTLNEIIRRHGTDTGFKDYLDQRKKIADIREKTLKNLELAGRLIERELVKTHIFGALEESNRRLLGDSPKTIARRLYALAASGAPVEEAEATVREIMTSQIKPAKATASRVLRRRRDA